MRGLRNVWFRPLNLAMRKLRTMSSRDPEDHRRQIESVTQKV